MGRQQRKQDRQARKKTKITATHSHSTGSHLSIGKQTCNASFVFNKNQFSSLINKGKQRQLQQEQAAAQRRGGTLTEHVSTPAEGSSIRKDLASAAANSNSTLPQDTTPAEEQADATFMRELDPTLTGRRDSSIKTYMRELRKVVDNADVLLQVLDARDPLGCRSLQTERMLMRAGKKIVLILNKIDLVPKSNVEAWLKYLRHDFPTLAFKASTQSQRNNLSQGANAVNYSKTSSSIDAISGGSEAIGAGALVELIKNYSRSLNLKTSIAVGVFGAPNVGKSSLINSLKRARVCSVASTPGHTKVVQSIMLDKSVRLLDCPGIVFSDESASGAASLGLSPDEVRIRRQSALLRNVVKVELVEDPITPVEAIMARVEPDHLSELYGLQWFQQGDAQDMLMRIAVQRGRMARGGKIDIEGTARSVLHDWNVGRIKYYSQPPALHRSAILTADNPDKAETGAEGEREGGVENKLAESTTILSGFSEAFDLAGLLGEADAEVFGVGTGEASGPLAEPPAPRIAPLEEEEEKEEEAIEDDHAPPAAATTVPSSTPSPVVGDGSHRSTLGKRSRRSSSISSAGNDSDDDFPSRTIAVPGLDADDDDDDASSDILPSSTLPLEEAGVGGGEWKDKLTAKASCKRAAEPSLAFSPEELAQMAQPTGAARRKLKKLKKRADKAGAGLVIKLQESKLDEEMDENTTNAEMGVNRKGIGGGMFGNVALPQKKKNEGGGGVAKKTGSMFDILMEGQNMDSDEEAEGEKLARTAAVVASTEQDYEEEL
ncbi:related to NUG1 - Nuclear GTPase (involved in Ribosome biogenesis) [Ustilago sp. UG-2017a]|nr:related to NUG1 - Nuclear GTPase (involved in Ribosome biogenesis) [Ustilago sp. UG-2017a]